ncbi:hypothetical protein ACFLFF_30505 [Brevibacillus reuszeri]|uniref:hypothetical protein n=1 Tax=Brevibacillus reuszeri TaxID=54915 RepID=UPI00366F46EC
METWRWIKFSLFAIWGLAVVIMFLLVFVSGFGLLSDEQAIQNAILFNRVTLVMALMSLPGALVSFLDIVKNDKKKYAASMKCPNCRHLIEVELKEK